MIVESFKGASYTSLSIIPTEEGLDAGRTYRFGVNNTDPRECTVKQIVLHYDYEGGESSEESSTPATTYTVTFMGHNGMVADTQTVTEGGYANAGSVDMENLFRNGYTFDGWDSDPATTPIVGPTTFTATWIRDLSDEYTIKIIYGDGSEETLTKNHWDILKVVAPATVGGDVFKGWMINGTFASANTTYSFYVVGNTEIEAVYETVPTANEPSIALLDKINTSVVNGKRVVMPEAFINVPAEYTKVEVGFIGSYYLEDTSVYLYYDRGIGQPHELKLDALGNKSIVSSKTTTATQITCSFSGIADGWSFCVRAFVTCDGPNGEETFYSNNLLIYTFD